MKRISLRASRTHSLGISRIVTSIGRRLRLEPLESRSLLSGTPYGEINGTKWNDLNADGFRSPGEPGLPGWTIFLDSDLDAALDPGEQSTVTDAQGNYSITGVEPGNYRVAEVKQENWQATNPQSGFRDVTVGNAVAVQRLFALRETSPLSTIVEYDPVSGAVLNSFPAPATIDSQYQGLAMGTNSLFFVDGGGSGPHTLWELNPDTGAVIDSDVVDAALPASRISGLAYFNGWLNFVRDETDRIHAWSTINDTLSSTSYSIPGLMAGGMSGAQDHNLLYTCDATGTITARNLTSGLNVAFSFDPGLGPLGGIAYINKELVVSRDAEPGVLYRLNRTTGAVLGTLAIGGTEGISDLAGDGALLLAPVDLIVNGGFETGDFTGWTVINAIDPFRPWAVSPVGTAGLLGPVSTPYGTYAAWNGFVGTGPTSFVMYQDITVPTSAIVSGLVWNDRVKSLGGGLPRSQNVQIRDPVTNEILSNTTITYIAPEDQTWESHSIGLGQFAGRTVRVFFEDVIPEGTAGPGHMEYDRITATVTPLAPVVNNVHFGNFFGIFPSSFAKPQLFYNNSAYDLNAGVDANDDLAIATNKVAYRPGMGPMTAATTSSPNSFVHVSSYSRGINGLLIDFENLHPSISASDFTFKVGQNNSPSLWANAIAPTSVTLRQTGLGLASGNTRVEIIWPNNSIRNTWLEVRVKANANTGINDADQAPDGDGIGSIFYFGNRVANSGHGDTVSFVTNATDEIQARNHPGSALPLTNRFDYNKDKLVAATDQILARNNPGILPFINIPNPPAAPAASALAVNDDDAVALALALASNKAANDASSSKSVHADRAALEQREPLLSRAAVAQCLERWPDSLERPRLKRLATKGDTIFGASEVADFGLAAALGKL